MRERESHKSGNPRGQIQFACFCLFFAIKTLKFKLHWAWLVLLSLHGSHHPLSSVTQLGVTCLVPEGGWSWEPGAMTSLDSLFIMPAYPGAWGGEAGWGRNKEWRGRVTSLLSSDAGSVAIPNLQPPLPSRTPVSWLIPIGFSAGKRKRGRICFFVFLFFLQ